LRKGSKEGIPSAEATTENARAVQRNYALLHYSVIPTSGKFLGDIRDLEFRLKSLLKDGKMEEGMVPLEEGGGGG